MPSSPPVNELPEDGEPVRRRRSLLKLVLVGVGLAVVLIGGTALQGALAPDASESPSPKAMAVYVDEYGVRVGTEATMDEDVTLSGPALSFGDTTVKGSMWPQDDSDHEGEDLDPLRLRAGTPVLIEATVRPPCEGEPFSGTVAMTVSSQPRSGEKTLLTFTAVNLAELRDAVPEWCDSGPTVRVTGSSLPPDGDSVATMLVINPGPDPVDVEIPAYSDYHVDWAASSGTVPDPAPQSSGIERRSPTGPSASGKANEPARTRHCITS